MIFSGHLSLQECWLLALRQQSRKPTSPKTCNIEERNMTTSQRRTASWPSAIGIGIVISILTSLFMVSLQKTGVSPLPKPLALALVHAISGKSLPLPAGLLLHTIYVTFWSVIFVRYFPRRNFWTAMALALFLWLIVLVIIFPIVGWGIAGLSISTMVIPASLMPHILFGILLWALDWFCYVRTAAEKGSR